MKNCFDRSTADDLFQETILKAWKNLKNYNEQNKFSSWLFSIAHNVLVDWARRKKRESVNHELNEMIIDNNQNLSNTVEIKELSELVNQKVVLLRQHSGMTFKEIADLTGDSINTVLSHMNYAIKKIRKSLKEENAI